MKTSPVIVAVLSLILLSGCNVSLGYGDTPAAVDAAFQWVIGERRLPDLGLIESQGREILVLEQNIQPSWLTPPEGKDLIFLGYDQLMQRARQSDFMYISFDEVYFDETGHVDIVVATRWAVSPDSSSVRLSGGSVKLRVSKRLGRWVIKEEYRVIAMLSSVDVAAEAELESMR